MSDPFEIYKMYQALKLHFNTENYDYFKYNGKTKVSETAFQTNKDKYAFVKLSRLCSDTELPFYAAAYYQQKQKIWIRDLIGEEAQDIYKKWTKQQQSRMYFFKEDLCKLQDIDFGESLKVIDGQSPELLTMVYQGEISQDNFLIIDEILDLMNRWTKKLDDFMFDMLRKQLLKYKPFLFMYGDLNVNEYKKVLINHLLPEKSNI